MKSKLKLFIVLSMLILNTAYSQNEDQSNKSIIVTADISPIFAASYSKEISGKSGLNGVLLSGGLSVHKRVNYKTYLDLGFWYHNIVNITNEEKTYDIKGLEIPASITFYLKDNFRDKQRTTWTGGLFISFGTYYGFNNDISGILLESKNNFGGQASFGFGIGNLKMSIMFKQDITSIAKNENLLRSRILYTLTLPIFSK